MTESTILATLGLVTVAAIVIVLLDRFAGRVLAADPENEDWPQ